jgi:hypothetical protein
MLGNTSIPLALLVSSLAAGENLYSSSKATLISASNSALVALKAKFDSVSKKIKNVFLMNCSI